jgi:sugar phosphate permease
MNHVVKGLEIHSRRQTTSLVAWIICGLGALFYCYEYLLRIAPSVMSGELMRSYHIDATHFGNLTAFYYYAYTPMQIIVGVFMDRYGPRLLVTIACLFCAAGTYLFACSDLLVVAQLGRFMVGFGSAFAFVGALKLATIWLPPEHFALVSGIIIGLGNLGAMVGDMFLTTLVKHSGWQQTSMYTALVGIFLALLIVLIVRDNNSKVSRTRDLTSFKTVFHGLWQVIRHKQIWLNGLVGALIYLPTTAFAELWGIPYLEQARGFSNADSAQIISMVFLGWVIGCPLVGFISDHFKRRLMPLMIGAVVAFVDVCILLYGPTLSIVGTSLLCFVLGAFACVQVLVFAIGRESSPKRIAGTAIALTNMLVMLGGVIFQPLVGWFLDMRWDGKLIDGVRQYSAQDFQQAMIVLPVGIAASFIVMWFVKDTRCKLSN